MIYYLTGTGALIEATQIVSKELKEMSAKFSEEERITLGHFIQQKASYDEFSVTTMFCNPWPQELMVIHDRFLNEELSRKFLGCLVFNVLHNDHRKWFATKSKLPQHAHREYESMFYAPYSLG